MIEFLSEDIEGEIILRNVSVVNGLYEVTYEINGSLDTAYLTMDGEFVTDKLVSLVFD